MARKLNAESEQFIKQWENGGDGSPKLVAYRDSGGVWTIGTGHTGTVDGRPVASGMRITAEQAQALFEADIAWACAAVERLVKVPLNDYEFGALVSWVLNVGVGNAEKSTLVRKLNQGNYEAVPHELMKWVKDQDPKTGKLVTVKGLQNRRAAECGLWVRTSFVASAVSEASPGDVQAADSVPATRDVTAHVATGGLGAIAVAAQPIKDLVDVLVGQQSELGSGDIVRMAIAGIIVCTLYVVWRKFKS